jgi:hypothetical protein
MNDMDKLINSLAQRGTIRLKPMVEAAPVAVKRASEACHNLQPIVSGTRSLLQPNKVFGSPTRHIVVLDDSDDEAVSATQTALDHIAESVNATALRVATQPPLPTNRQQRDLAEGQQLEISGPSKQKLKIALSQGVYSCWCSEWKEQCGPPTARTCSHLKEFRGSQKEEERVSSALQTDIPAAPVVRVGVGAQSQPQPQPQPKTIANRSKHRLKLQIVSDIHFENRAKGMFVNPTKTIDFEAFLQPTGDILALLGDIGQPDIILDKFIQWCSTKFQHVFYIAGNHELYSPLLQTPYTTILKQIRDICTKYPNVHFLENETFAIEDLMFIGSTLWSYIPMRYHGFIQGFMNDYNYIFSPTGGPITPAEITSLFSINHRFIFNAIRRAERDGFKAVVLTHHAPSFHRTSTPEHTRGPSPFAFATHLPASHWPGPIFLWGCGHTHTNFSHRKEGYLLVSNQVGYGNPKTVALNSFKATVFQPNKCFALWNESDINDDNGTCDDACQSCD